MAYPKCPKMNAHVERFNRTLQEECIDYHEDLLFTDLQLFNDRLWDYLQWYNLQRPQAVIEQKPLCHLLPPNPLAESNYVLALQG